MLLWWNCATEIIWRLIGKTRQRRGVFLVPISVGLRWRRRDASSSWGTRPSQPSSTAALVSRAKCCDNGIMPPARPLDHRVLGRPLPVECTLHEASPLSTCGQAENAKIYMCCASHNNELHQQRRETSGHDSNSQVTMCWGGARRSVILTFHLRRRIDKLIELRISRSCAIFQTSFKHRICWWTRNEPLQYLSI